MTDDIAQPPEPTGGRPNTGPAISWFPHTSDSDELVFAVKSLQVQPTTPTGPSRSIDTWPPTTGTRSPMLLIPFLVFTAFTIILGVVAWAWANGTLVETPQERVDRQFELIVRQLSE